MRLVFLLEEPSARELLRGLVPRLAGDHLVATYLVFEGKQDLERQLVRKLRGWKAPASVFVVLRDQDAGDCARVKRDLSELVITSGREAETLVRVACRDLESWIAGDLRAVAAAFGEPAIADHAGKARFRDPDSLVRPVDALRTLVPEYQKIDGARRVGPHLDPERNTSRSFAAFCTGLRRIVGTHTNRH